MEGDRQHTSVLIDFFQDNHDLWHPRLNYSVGLSLLYTTKKKYPLSILFDTLELQIVTCSENVVSLKVWLYFTRTPVHRRGKYERNCNDKRASERSPWQSEECVDLPGRIAVGQEPCLNKLWKTAKHTSVTTSSNYCFLLARKWHSLRRIFFLILQGKNVVIGTRT